MSENAEIYAELKRLRNESWIKDVLLAVVPLLVAGISIYYSNQNSKQQLRFAQEQMLQNRQIENAKLLEGFSQRILNGGREADLARVALDSITLSSSQKTQLASFFESEAGGSDQIDLTTSLVEASVEVAPPLQGDKKLAMVEPLNVDVEVLASEAPPLADLTPEERLERHFASVLPLIFSDTRETRIEGYSQVQSILSQDYSADFVLMMLDRIRSDPFNISGRSNVLSILSDLSAENLVTTKKELLEFLSLLEDQGKDDPTYAVGPQTQDWIKRIRDSLN